MRNLKRALSLALASVMLLGMMVVGTSAAFADADEIVNTEAVEITAGLGLFAGSDGKFNPKGNVTRAQMATVIVKMLYGSEINADQYKGIAKFNDVASFEGGWAEGYINLCANLGVVGGYGDGSFKPGNSVTTAEAVTMIINALGVDAGKGTWPLTVMAKAEEMKLFEELAVKPATNVALTRDQLASVVLEGLKYSPAGNNGYAVTVGGKTFTFEKISDALLAANGDLSLVEEVVGEDSLAKTVFEMISVTGFVTANQATGADYTVVNGIALNLESGLDMIGHFVTAYYAEAYESEDEPGKAYCIVDEAKYVKVDKPEVDTKKEYQAFFGNKAIPALEEIVIVDGEFKFNVGAIANYDETIWTAGKGTYVIYEGEIIAYIKGADTVASKINKVTTTAGKESITVNGVGLLANAEDDDVVVEYDGIAKDDIVLVSVAQDTMVTLTKATAVTGQISKISANEYGQTTITVGGTTYVAYTNDISASGLSNNTATVDFDKTYEIYTVGEKYIGWKAAASEANVSDVIYVLGGYPVTTTDAYGNDVTNIYAQGVDMTGKEVSILVGIDYAINNADNYTGTVEDLGLTTAEAVEAGYATYKLSTNKDEKKANIMIAEALAEAYNEDEPSIYTGTATKEMKSDTASLRTGAGELAFITESTKFIVVEGTLGKTLEIAVMTGSISKNVEDAAIVLSQDDYDNVTLEVMVIEVEDLSIMAEDYIFVSAAQIEAGATVGTAEYEYEVYFAETGEKKVIITDAVIEAAGFYTYATETEDGKTIYDLTVEEPSTFALQNVVFESAKGTNLVAAGIEGLNAAEAKIIDTRAEKVLAESNVAEITELADMADAKAADHQVVFWALLDEEEENVTNIFVVAVNELCDVCGEFPCECEEEV